MFYIVDQRYLSDLVYDIEIWMLHTQSFHFSYNPRSVILIALYVPYSVFMAFSSAAETQKTSI